MAAPTSSPMPAVGDRIATLDLIRGIAVMGILAANIVGFGFPEFAYFSPAAMDTPSRPDLIAWAATFVLVEGKMRGLFSFLFGASMLLVTDRARAAGEDPVGVHYSRMAWLFVFGVAHFYLLWWGDILALYAQIGALAFLFHRLPARALLILGLMLVALQTVEVAGVASYAFQLHRDAATTGASAATLAEWRDFASSMGRPDGATIARELGVGRGGYGALVAWRWAQEATPFSAVWQVGAETLGYMLLGMAGLRSGFLTGAWEPRRYIGIALATLGIGWPLYAMIGAFDIRHAFDPRYVFLSSIVLGAPLRPFVITGYAALIILLGRQGGWLTRRIAAAGRMAFSNYLGTTLICTTLFYGYGLGWYGHVDRWQLDGVVLGVCLLMLAWSKPWLDRYRYGPLEWLWRSLSRMSFQPMRGSAFATNDRS